MTRRNPVFSEVFYKECSCLYDSCVRYFICKRCGREQDAKDLAYKAFLSARKLGSACGRVDRSQELGIKNCMLVVFDACELEFMSGKSRKGLINAGVSSGKIFCESVATCVCASLSRGYSISALFMSDVMRRTYERMRATQLRNR